MIATCMQLSKNAWQSRRSCRQLLGALSAIACLGPTAAKRSSWWKKAQEWKPWTRLSTISAWPWARLQLAILPASTLAGASARNIATWKSPAFASHSSKISLCELGRFGQKTGAGWYKYDEHRRRNAGSRRRLN